MSTLSQDAQDYLRAFEADRVPLGTRQEIAHLTALRAVLHMDAGADAAQVIERVGAVVEAGNALAASVKNAMGTEFGEWGNYPEAYDEAIEKWDAALHVAPQGQGG